MKHLITTARIATPAPAAALYAAEPRLAPAHTRVRLGWDDRARDSLLAEFRALNARWQHLPSPHPKGLWNVPKAFTTRPLRGGPGKPALRGRCTDFAPQLAIALAASQGVARGALSLTVCTIVSKVSDYVQPHMVLAIETEAGTMICCNIRGCHALDSGEWDNEYLVYRWDRWEDPDPDPAQAWGSLKSLPTLADVVARTHADPA